MMANHSAVYAFLAIIFYVLDATHGLELYPKADSLEKCEPHDENCLKQYFTHIAQNWRRYPHLGMPCLDPFEPSDKLLFKPLQVTKLLFAQICWSNMKIRGLDQLIIQEISGLDLNRPTSHCQVKVFIPKLVVETSSNTEMKVVALPVKLVGVKTMTMGNIEVLADVKSTVEQRDGKQYICIDDVSVVSTDIETFKMEFSYQYMLSTIANLIDSVIASNWKMIKTMIEPTANRYIGDIIKSLLVPILQATPVQDIVNMESSTTELC